MNKNTFRITLIQIIELVAVIVIGFGLFITSSTLNFLHGDIKSPTKIISTTDFYSILIYEVFAFILILYILKKRDWKKKDFNLDFKINMIGIAIILVILRYALRFLFNVIFFNNPNTTTDITLDISLISIILMVIINSFYEEFILIGYLFKRLERFHISIIIAFSLLIRLSFHTYQGVGAIPSILALGLILGLYYAYFKKLGPVIIAHALGNIIVFLEY